MKVSLSSPSLWVNLVGAVGLALVSLASTIALGETSVSDGKPLSIDKLGITITPPIGWEVMQESSGLSLVMKEAKPKVEIASDSSKTTFRRNVTVAAMHKSSPIDQKRAEELKKDLLKTYAQDPMIKDYQITEHKFFNYKGVNDGLLIYAAFMIGEFKMMHMHVLVSGKDKQFLLTYADLAQGFGEGATYEAAWASMVSIDVKGLAPNRYEELLKNGSMAGGLLVLVSVIGLIRRRSARKDYLKDTESLSFDSDDEVSDISTIKDNSDDDLCQSGFEEVSDAKTNVESWHFSRFKDLDGSSDNQVEKAGEDLEFVSNF